MKSIRRYIYLMVLIPSILTLTGCLEREEPAPAGHYDYEEATFSYAIPGMAAATRAEVMSDAQEAAIGTVDALVYEVGGDGHERLSYRQWGTAIDPAGHTGTFKVKLARSKESEKYTIDFIFNARDAVTDALEKGDIALGDKRDDVRKKLKIDSAHWPVTPQSYLPMWAGIRVPVQITKNTVFAEELIPVRAVAKIDIGLRLDDNNSAAGLDNFKLKNVYPTSYGANAGLLVPDPASMDASKALSPSFPEPYTQTTQLLNVDCTDLKSVLNGIYLFETDANFTGENGERYGVIFKGEYSDNSGTNDYYYRLEFFDPDDRSRRIDLLRNHRYRINILAIEGPGYSTLDEAIVGKPGNVVYELNVNEGGDINHIAYSDKYMLGVSSLALSYESSPVTGVEDLKVLTNYERGWQVSVVDEFGGTPGWIGFTTPTGQAHVKTAARFDLEHFSYSDTPRRAVATFTAGALSIGVTISQFGNFYISTDYDGSLMRGDGDQWDIYVWGEVPSGFAVIASSDREGVKTGVSWDTIPVPAATYTKDAPFTAPLAIIGNAWLPMAIRQVAFEYTLDVGVTWIPFREGPQEKGHFHLPLDGDTPGHTGRMVALYNMDGKYKWTEAMGIEPRYGEEYFYTWNPDADTYSSEGPITHYWRSNYGYSPHPDYMTGCADYYEEDYPEYERGKWRLPSKDEMWIIGDHYLHIGDLPFGSPNDPDVSYYWSSSEDTGGEVFASNSYGLDLRYGRGFSYLAKNTHELRVRCVYGEPVANPPATP